MTRAACVAALALLGPLAGSCTNAPVDDWCALWGRPDPVDANCMRVHATQEYLDSLARHLAKVYERPAGLPEVASVDVRFTLARSGALASRCVLRSSDERFAVSLLDAFDRAAFPELPYHARCIAGAELRQMFDLVER